MLDTRTLSFGKTKLEALISYDLHPRAWVIFAHASGSSHRSRRSQWLARDFNRRGYGTLLFDLLTPSEDNLAHNRFNIELFSARLLAATEWLMDSDYYQHQPMAFMGCGTGTAGALLASLQAHGTVPLFSIISRGGRPDLLSLDQLRAVSVPTLFIVGSKDHTAFEAAEGATLEMEASDLNIIDGAGPLFDETGALGEVVEVGARWLDSHLPRQLEVVPWH